MMQWLSRTPSVDLIGAIGLMVIWSVIMQPWLGLPYSLSVLAGVMVLTGILWWQWPSQWGAAADVTRWGQQSVLRLSSANQVTLGRALLVIGVLSMISVPQSAQQWIWPLTALSVCTFLLDGVDGWLARRQRSQSAFGARFDMEVDAAFILGLCVMLWVLERADMWVLWVGALRYLFWGGGFVWQALQRPLPPSQRRRWVCGWQIVSLLIALPGVLPASVTHFVLVSALVVLVYSFGRDVGWLWKEAKHA